MLPFFHTSRILLGVLTILSVLVLAKSDTGHLTSSLACPVSVSGPGSVMADAPIVFTAEPGNYGSYSWSLSSGDIISGQGTSSITVVNVSMGGSCTATVQISHQGCTSSSSATVTISGLPLARPVEQYGNIRFNDEKARLDNLAILVQNDPRATVYLIGYGTCKNEGLARANRAKNYLVNSRQIDPNRVVVVDGGCRSEFLMELWLVPEGATPPEPRAGDDTPCVDCKRAPARRNRNQRRP